jgi:hypothetical protein
MSHTIRKYVFAGRAGDRNVPWPSTPSNLQHWRQRLPELGRRHPSPEGRTSPHQLHSKTIRDPQPPTAVPIFLFLVAGAASREGPSLATTTGFSHGGQQPQQRHLQDSHRMANGLIRKPNSSKHWTLGYPNSADPLSSVHTAPQYSPLRPPLHELTRPGLGRADPKRRPDFEPAAGPK